MAHYGGRVRDLAPVRRAIGDEEKLGLDYRDEQGNTSNRIIRPIALIYYLQTTNIVAWCELRQAIRNFRSDRIERCQPTGAWFKGEGEALRTLWTQGWESQAGTDDDASLSRQSAD